VFVIIARRRKEIVRMRNVIWILLAGVILPCVGCAGNSGLAGKWLGSVMEKGKATECALNLQTQGDAVGGTFTIFSDANDKDAGTSFVLYNARCSENKLEFVVPISGELDADAVFFEMLVKGDRLEGYGRKMRQGSPNLTAVFVKQK
jgi:hypothetical protein